jgi:hypothetical protein
MKVCEHSATITPVSRDPQDLEALTPNHILLMRQNPSTSAKECGKVESYKARWKHVQSLASTFWERWIRDKGNTYRPYKKRRNGWKRNPILVSEI